MSGFQKFRGDPETKLFYLLDALAGGINTEFSDDASSDTDFDNLVNFDIDKMGSLKKRNGFGELSAISQIFNLLSSDLLPNIKNKTPDNTNPENENDNVVYMKLIQNDNNCFRNLSAFSGDNAYRKYQELYGFQDNKFTLLLITVKENTTTSWLYKCELPELGKNSDGSIKDTIKVTCKKTELPVVMNYDRNLMNLDTIEFYDKIYMTGNNKGLICFDRTNETFIYSGFSDTNIENNAYKPTALEIAKVGFNVLGDDPMHYINFQNISTDSIQGVYISTVDNIPLLKIPLGNKFLLNVLYTGSDNGFSITMNEGGKTLEFTSEEKTNLASTGLKVYEITFANNPTTEVEIKIEKINATIEPYYDYYEIASIDPEAKKVEKLNIGSHRMLEMYNRAVYYKDDTIWFSDINNFNYIPNYNYVTLPIEPTDEITKICYFKNIYVVFTKERIYKLTGSFGSSDFSLSPVNLSLGCHAGNTVVPIENLIYFASPRGLYALKSSEFRDGIENVVELDTKVKKLTSDYTLYSEELSQPSIRFNGISEKAYAFRYKDKYMLFFNSSFDKGDYAALNDLDVLVYNYDMKSYTTYRFKEKPTFLFMVDNAIETFCTVSNRELYVDEEVLLNYNFDTANGNTVVDSSGNRNDATLMGNAVLNGGAGVTLNGKNSYIQMDTISKDVNIANNLSVDMDVDLSGANIDNTLFELSQSYKSRPIQQKSGSITTNSLSGYNAKLVYQGTSNGVDKILVKYTITLNRESTDINAQTSGVINLQDDLGNILINNLSYSCDFKDSLSLDVISGELSIDSSSNEDYVSNWNLEMQVQYETTSSYYEKDNGFSGTLSSDTQLSWIEIGLPYSVVTYDGYTRVTISKPYVKNKYALNVGSRTLDVFIGGQKLSFTIPAISSTGTHSSSSSKYVDIFYNADSKKVTVKSTYNIKATIKGSYRASVSSDDFTLTLPKNKYVTTTNTSTLYLRGNKLVTYLREGSPSFRQIYLKILNNKLLFHLENEYRSYDLETDEFILAGRHNIGVNVKLGKVEILLNYEVVATGLYDSVLFINSDRDACYIGTDKDKTNYLSCNLYSFNSNFASYIFTKGSGDIVKDKTSNNINGKLVNCVWLIESGLRLDGVNSYLQLPDLEAYFSNGFKVEFDAQLDANSSIYRIFDFASKYGSNGKADNNCSINVGVNKTTLAINSTNSNYKTMKLTTNSVDLKQRHNYVIICKDTGKNYNVSITVDNVIVSTTNFDYGAISNIIRKSNFIGKSNNETEGYLKGLIHNFKFTIFANLNPIKLYRSALYEFDTAYNDFGRSIYVELKTKGINMKYPLHIKKLKNIFVKVVGGYKYNEFFFELYKDNYIVNNPKIYNCYINNDGQVVYDYTEQKELVVDEKVSLLGNMRIDETRLGEGNYQTKKLVIPSKGKNFTLRMYGDTDDFIGVESFGFVAKLGKVKQG